MTLIPEDSHHTDATEWIFNVLRLLHFGDGLDVLFGKFVLSYLLWKPQGRAIQGTPFHRQHFTLALFILLVQILA